MGDNMQSRYDIKVEGNVLVNELYEKITKELLERFGHPSMIEVQVRDCKLIGNIDAIIGKYCIEFKTVTRDLSMNDYLQCWFYKIISNKDYIPIVINLQNGDVKSISSPQHILRWKYILNAYTQIRIHTELVQFRLTKSIENGLQAPKYPLNTFTVDTEFAGYGSIFDLTCININDPYRSFVQTIHVNEEHMAFATSWSKLSSLVFESSPKINQIQDLFYKLQRINLSNPVEMNYYVSPVDVSWCSEYKNVNVGSKARQIALKYGCYIGNSSAPPKLTDLYNTTCKPLDFLPHLIPHTSLSDALILYELMVLGIL
jgi:hypothetical protein